MPTKNTIQIKGTIQGGTFEAVRGFVFSELVPDVGLCNMMIRFIKDNPMIVSVDSIKTLESIPYDWEEEMFGIPRQPKDEELE